MHVRLYLPPACREQLHTPTLQRTRTHTCVQATIMTDPGLAHRTHIGPMTVEYAEQIVAKVSVLSVQEVALGNTYGCARVCSHLATAILSCQVGP